MTGIVLFAGGGLFDHGLVEANIHIELGIEWDEHAVKVAKRTGLHHTVHGDVRQAAELWGAGRPPDLMWSSFPCQAWSTAGKRKGAQDERNGWPWTVDAIDALKPKWFIAENVRGLTFHKKTANCGRGKDPKPLLCPGCYLDHTIMPDLRKRFGWAEYRVLDSADYGTPQHRRRVFIVAGPRAIEWPEATHGKGLLPHNSMGEALGLTGYTLDGGRNLANHPTQERPVDVSAEPAPCLSGRGNAVLRAFNGQRTAMGPRPAAKPGQPRPHGRMVEKSFPVTDPAPTLTGAPLKVERAIGGGRNPQSSEVADKRNYRDLTDEPCVTLTAAQVGNRGPWIEHRLVNRRGREGGAVDEGRSVDLPATAMRTPGGGSSIPWIESRWSGPAPTVTTTEVKGTRASPGKPLRNGPDRASDALALGTGYCAKAGEGRRRLTVKECRILMNAPERYDEALATVTKTAAYRILGNGGDRTMSRLLGEAVMKADQS